MSKTQAHAKVETKSTLHSGKKGKSTAAMWSFPLVKKNFIILGLGVAVILLGYLLMATAIGEGPAVVDGKWNNVWAVVVAPFLLVIGYFGLIPYGVWKFFNTASESNHEETK